MKIKLADLSLRYRAALRKHLNQDSGSGLRIATGLGSQAMKDGFDASDLSRIHEQAVLELLPGDCPTRTIRHGLIKQAAQFFNAAIMPIVDALPPALKSGDGQIRSGRLSKPPGRRSAAGDRWIKLEIARRETVEEALKKSKLHYAQLLSQSSLMQERLRHLSHKILLTQEAERKEISRELHDQIAQTLSGINVHLAGLKVEAATNPKGLVKKIVRTQRLVEKSVNIVHRFARELRPTVLDDLGLVPALQSYVKDFASRTRLPVSLAAVEEVERLSGDERIVLYRVAQAALTNVARHAKASAVSLNIRTIEADICMEIKDNGKSFDVERVLFAKRHQRLGVLGMRERVEMVGGSFAIESAPGKGTTIRARIPCGAIAEV